MTATPRAGAPLTAGVNGAEGLPRPLDRGLRGWVARHQVLSFFVTAYLISWPLWGFAAVGGGQVPFLLGGLGPVTSAIIVTLASGLGLTLDTRGRLGLRTATAARSSSLRAV